MPENPAHSSRAIAASELILNDDGSIYHLALRPGELAETILLVGDPGRVERVSRRFDSIELKRKKREFITHTGWVGRRRISVISSGIGTDNIDIVLNEADALFNIDFESRLEKERHTPLTFLRIGTSGSIRPDIEVDTQVASAYAIGMDSLFQFYEVTYSETEQELNTEIRELLQDEGLLLLTYAFQGDWKLLSQVGKGMHVGITLTSPGFYGPQGRRLRRPSRLQASFFERAREFTFQGFPLSNFEMESAAIYGLSKLLGHRALSCNAILANRPKGTFSKNPKKAVSRLIENVLENIAV